MQVIICDVCHRGVDASAERVYGTLNLQTSMGLGTQTIDAHRSCYERLMGLLRGEAKAELPHVWREGDPNEATTPIDPGPAPAATSPEEPLPPPGDPAGPTDPTAPAPEPAPETAPAEPEPATEPAPDPAASPAEPAPADTTTDPAPDG